MQFHKISMYVSDLELEGAKINLLEMYQKDLPARLRHAIGQSAHIETTVARENSLYGTRVSARSPDWRAILEKVTHEFREHLDRSVGLVPVDAGDALTDYVIQLLKDFPAPGEQE